MKNYTISKMVCTNCGQEGIPIPRPLSRSREKNHLKKLYCLNCREYHNHMELRDNWDAEYLKMEVENEQI